MKNGQKLNLYLNSTKDTLYYYVKELQGNVINTIFVYLNLIFSTYFYLLLLL